MFLSFYCEREKVFWIDAFLTCEKSMTYRRVFFFYSHLFFSATFLQASSTAAPGLLSLASRSFVCVIYSYRCHSYNCFIMCGSWHPLWSGFVLDRKDDPVLAAAFHLFFVLLCFPSNLWFLCYIVLLSARFSVMQLVLIRSLPHKISIEKTSLYLTCWAVRKSSVWACRSLGSDRTNLLL